MLTVSVCVAGTFPGNRVRRITSSKLLVALLAALALLPCAEAGNLHFLKIAREKNLIQNRYGRRRRFWRVDHPLAFIMRCPRRPEQTQFGAGSDLTGRSGRYFPVI